MTSDCTAPPWRLNLRDSQRHCRNALSYTAFFEAEAVRMEIHSRFPRRRQATAKTLPLGCLESSVEAAAAAAARHLVRVLMASRLRSLQPASHLRPLRHIRLSSLAPTFRHPHRNLSSHRNTRNTQHTTCPGSKIHTRPLRATALLPPCPRVADTAPTLLRADPLLPTLVATALLLLPTQVATALLLVLLLLSTAIRSSTTGSTGTMAITRIRLLPSLVTAMALLPTLLPRLLPPPVPST